MSDIKPRIKLEGKSTTLERITTVWSKIVNLVVAALVGFCLSQVTGIAELHKISIEMPLMDKRITKLEADGSDALRLWRVTSEKEDASLRKDLETTKIDFGQRIANITALLERMVDQQTQLIAFLKAKETVKVN